MPWLPHSSEKGVKAQRVWVASRLPLEQVARACLLPSLTRPARRLSWSSCPSSAPRLMASRCTSPQAALPSSAGVPQPSTVKVGRGAQGSGPGGPQPGSRVDHRHSMLVGAGPRVSLWRAAYQGSHCGPAWPPADEQGGLISSLGFPICEMETVAASPSVDRFREIAQGKCQVPWVYNPGAAVTRGRSSLPEETGQRRDRRPGPAVRM